MRRCLKDCRHFFVALAISLSLTLLGAGFLVQRNAQMRIAELESVFTLQTDKLTSILTKYFYKTQTLAAITITGSGKIENFEQVACLLYTSRCV